MATFLREETPPRLREDLRRRPQRAAAAAEFGAVLAELGLTQSRIAQVFNVTARCVRRWQRGERRLPRGICIVIHLLRAGAVTVDQVEQAALPVPTRTNGSAEPAAAVPVPARANGNAKPEPHASLEKASQERSLRLAVKTPALAAEAATFADSGLSTAEKVYELAANGCRWCEGDPQRPDFFFCDATTEKGPYCARHRARAYLTRSFTTLAGLPPTISSIRSAQRCSATRTSSA